MKRKVLLIGIMIMFVLSYSQVPADKTVQQILMSKTWHFGDTPKVGMRFVFTHDSMEFYVVGAYGYDNFKGKIPYYLSDTKDSFFDYSKVDKDENGLYLIEKSSAPTRDKPKAHWLKILEIDDKHIKFEGIDNRNERKILIYTAVK
ncbi:hypothetical protein [uncultured Bacteroides sp.]|uniref:hypothetical protein n=1 Tax=uncultured Bacteroides sp. TaxID=162156 RepID=UPI0025D9A1EE|nr:hypothetical protein [uncultured Bacteroides sp.]